MAIFEKIGEDSKKFYKYEPPHWEVLYDKLAEFLDIFGLFVGLHTDLKMNDIDVDKPVLSELLVRVDKRRDYFVVFHDDTDMNEIKEAALFAYWIIKFKPFIVKDVHSRLHIKYTHINEAFAVFIIYSAIKEKAFRSNKMKFSISKNYNKKIMYAFQYWDISKEALMLTTESLCEAMHIQEV